MNSEDLFPNLEHVLRSLGLDDEKTLNVYLFGSRVYGNHKEDSDWDFRIVYKNYQGTLF